MDNLTHTAVGLFLSRAGLGRWSPRAAAVLLVAANAPDIDIVTMAGGPLNYLHYHRHFTHSLVAMPLMAFASVLLVRYAGRKPLHWAGAFAAALLGVASHLILDLTNIYGIRLLLPFSGEWQRLDITGVIDLWIWGVFLLAIVGPFLARLVGSEIASSPVRPAHHGRGAAWAALAFLLFYDCGRSVLHARVVAALSSHLYQDAPPIRVAAMPDSTKPWRWYGLVETSGAYSMEIVDLTGAPVPEHPMVFQKPDPNPALEAAARSFTFVEFLRFSQFPLWRVSPVSPQENGHLVEVLDLRFGTPMAPGFRASAVVDANQRVLESSFQFGRVRPK